MSASSPDPRAAPSPQGADGRTGGRLPVVVMGVAGSGKTTLGLLLAEALGVAFVDGDALHPAENVAKMAAGVPLTDADRWPWLDRIGALLADEASHPPGLVTACSALRRAYRDRLRAAVPDLRFVFLDADLDEMARRLAARPDHFMPASLAQSQFAALERPVDEADVVTLPPGLTPQQGVDHAVRFLKRHGI